MRSSLERDLARWERGELSVADLGLRHPGRAAGMVALYQRLTDIGGAAVPDPEPGWERLRERLPQRPDVVQVRTLGPAFVLRRLVARPLALAAALVLFGGAIGYAAAPQAVNHRLSSFWEGVEDLFRDEPRQGGPDRTPGSAGDDEPGLAPSVPDDEDGDDGGDGEAGEDDGEDGDDDREGPSEDSGEGSGDGDEDDEAAEPSDGESSNEGSGDGSDEGSGSDGSSFEEEADESSLDPDDPVEPDD